MPPVPPSKGVTSAAIRILAINDVYELTNLPRLLSLRKSLNPQPDAFVVSGDFLSPSVLSSVDQGRGMVDMLNAIGVTHVCFGNHEADLSLDVLSERIKESNFTWVNTNMPSFPGFSNMQQQQQQHDSNGGGNGSDSDGSDIDMFAAALLRASSSSSSQQPSSSPPSSSSSSSAAAAATATASASPLLLHHSNMVPASYVTSKCGSVSAVLLGLISDEPDMFRDGTFKGLSIQPPTAECVQLAHQHFVEKASGRSGGSGESGGSFIGETATIAATGDDSVVATAAAAKIAAEPVVGEVAVVIIPMTHETMSADAGLAKECALRGVPLPLLLGGHEHELMLEVHPSGRSYTPPFKNSSSSPSPFRILGAGSGVRLESGGKRRSRIRKRMKEKKASHKPPPRFNFSKTSSSSSSSFFMGQHKELLKSSSSSSPQQQQETLVVKTGSDAEQAAVIDIRFVLAQANNNTTNDAHTLVASSTSSLSPSMNDFDFDGGEEEEEIMQQQAWMRMMMRVEGGQEEEKTMKSKKEKRFLVRSVDVAMVDVKAKGGDGSRASGLSSQLQADLPAQLRAERHLSVVANLEDAPLVDMNKFQNLFSLPPKKESRRQKKTEKGLRSTTTTSFVNVNVDTTPDNVGGLPWGALGCNVLGSLPLSSERSRFRQTTVGALLALAAKEELGADVCAINGAPVKGNRAYADGVITFRQLKQELPFPTKMVVVSLPGHVLQACVTHSRTVPPLKAIEKQQAEEEAAADAVVGFEEVGEEEEEEEEEEKVGKEGDVVLGDTTSSSKNDTAAATNIKTATTSTAATATETAFVRESTSELRGFLQLDPGVEVEHQYQWLAHQTREHRAPPLPTGYGGNVFIEVPDEDEDEEGEEGEYYDEDDEENEDEEEEAQDNRWNIFGGGATTTRGSVVHRGLSDPSVAHRILSVGGKPFDLGKTYNVALPRNLLKGFCNVTPLVEWHNLAQTRKAEAQWRLMSSYSTKTSLEGVETESRRASWLAYAATITSSSSKSTSSSSTYTTASDSSSSSSVLPSSSPSSSSSSLSSSIFDKARNKLTEVFHSFTSSSSSSPATTTSPRRLTGSGAARQVGLRVQAAAAAASSSTSTTGEEETTPTADPLTAEEEALLLLLRKSVKSKKEEEAASNNLVEESRLLPTEDAYIPCLNLVVAFFTKTYWRELAASFSFDDMDFDKSGRIDRTEIARAFELKHGKPPPAVLLDSMMKSLGKEDENAVINRSEYEAFVSGRNGQARIK